MKGAADVVRTGLECLKRGIDIELHCYGEGSLSNEMCRLATPAPGTITIHDAVPYPELVEISRTFDAFVCCHVQNDPSCTYLEALGAGLPIIGYANRMWSRLQKASGAGYMAKTTGFGGHPLRQFLISRRGRVAALCNALQTLGDNSF